MGTGQWARNRLRYRFFPLTALPERPHNATAGVAGVEAYGGRKIVGFLNRAIPIEGIMRCPHYGLRGTLQNRCRSTAVLPRNPPENFLGDGRSRIYALFDIATLWQTSGCVVDQSSHRFMLIS